MNATIGVLFRLSSTGVDLGDYWHAVGCCARLALRHINSQDGSVVTDLSSGSSSWRLRSISYDTGSDPLIGYTQYRHAHGAGVHALLGAARSATNEVIGFDAALNELPQMAFWASAPLLSDKRYYSHFARTWPSDARLAVATCAALSSLNFTNVAMLRVLETWADGVATHVAAAAPEHGVTIQLSVSFEYDDECAEMEAAVDVIARSGFNLIFTLLFEDHLACVLASAEARGMLHT